MMRGHDLLKENIAEKMNCERRPGRKRAGLLDDLQVNERFRNDRVSNDNNYIL